MVAKERRRTTSDETIEVALLVDEAGIRSWAVDALRRLVTERPVDINYVVVNQGREPEGTRDAGVLGSVREYINKVRAHGPWAPVAFLNFVHEPPEYYRREDLNSIRFISEAETIRCHPEPAEGIGNVLPLDVVREIESVDLVIRFGFGIIQGEVLDAGTLGVLSFHHGDIRRYRGRPPGLWEFLKCEDEVGITLQRLNETLDGGEIVAYKSIDIRNLRTWQSIRATMMAESEDMLVNGLDNVTESTVQSPDEIGDLYHYPGWWDTARYIVKNSAGRIRNRISLEK